MRHPQLIAFLISIILSLIIPEIALQIIDPLQAKPYFADIWALFSAAVADDTRGYVLPAGEYRFSDWTATILEDHSRYVPDTHESDCTITFVGDSVTFGHGVNDSETWVNLLAQRLPDANLINAGLNGYNGTQALATIREGRASGFFYTLISNDADRIKDWQRRPPPAFYEPILPVYLYVLAGMQEPAFLRDYEAFDTALSSIKEMSTVAITGFEGDPLATRAGIDTVPYWTHYNSPTDTHANAAGNSEIADAMMPYVASLIENTCPT